MHQAIPCLITGLGCASVPTVGCVVLVSKNGNIEKENKKLEGDLKELKDKIDYPMDDFIVDLLDKDRETFKGNWNNSGLDLNKGNNVRYLPQRNDPCRNIGAKEKEGDQYRHYLICKVTPTTPVKR